MSKEKQIEEYLTTKLKPKNKIDCIAWLLLNVFGCKFCKACRDKPCNIKDGETCTNNIANYIREVVNEEAGYRKQSEGEWIEHGNWAGSARLKEKYRLKDHRRVGAMLRKAVSDMDYMASVIEKIIVKRNEAVDSAILGEIQQITVEEGIETKIILNKKNVADALRKQIPQKVNISLKGTTDWNTRCHCPVCHKDLFDGQKYCSYCGQLIDWGE